MLAGVVFGGGASIVCCLADFTVDAPCTGLIFLALAGCRYAPRLESGCCAGALAGLMGFATSADFGDLYGCVRSTVPLLVIGLNGAALTTGIATGLTRTAAALATAGIRGSGADLTGDGRLFTTIT